jgi:integrase
VGYYNERQKAQILSAVNGGIWERELTNLKYRLIVYMFFQTWLRCHELVKIKVEDIGESLQVIGKWRKRRTVYLRKELLDMIWEYLDKRKEESEYLFPNKWRHGQHMTDSAVRGVFFKLTKRLGFWIHPHKFRHTFATDMLNIPWSNIYYVAKLLRHKNINTTQVYLWLNDVELKKIQFWLKF